jgi:hypothetical protein
MYSKADGRMTARRGVRPKPPSRCEEKHESKLYSLEYKMRCGKDDMLHGGMPARLRLSLARNVESWGVEWRLCRER